MKERKAVMNPVFNDAITLEEAAVCSRSRPFLPYQPEPVISKLPYDDPLQPLEPLRVFDNVYWLGSRHVGAIVIDTGEGLIMIDSGSDDKEAAYIADSFAKLGLDVSTVKLIIASHEHFDHYGGMKYLLRESCPGAMAAISRVGWNLLQTVPTEFAFIEPRPLTPDILLDDGLCLKLGDTRLLCIATPGHSAGCFSFIFSSSLHGEELTVGFMGGSAVWPNFPEARIYQASVDVFSLYANAAGCNAFTGTHQRESALDAVRDHWSKGTPHPWVCPKEEYDKAYLQSFRNFLLNTIYSGYMQPYMRPAMGGHEPAPEGSPLPPRESL